MSVSADITAFVELWDVTGDFTDFAAAIGVMFAEVESFAEDTDTTVGWQKLWDVDLATGAGLTWLAQFGGDVLPAGSTDTQARALIKAAPNQDRGTPLAIANAVKQTLTGGQLIGLKERWRSDTAAEDDDAISIFTYQSQTPNQGQVLEALRRTVPADIDVYYSCLAGPTWAALESGAGSGTWANLISHYGGGTWAEIENATLALPGYTLY